MEIVFATKKRFKLSFDKVKKILALIIICIGLNCCALFETESSADIQLSKPMLNIKGDTILLLNLPPATAAILRYPNKIISTSVVTPHVPRALKSIRLGGYYFGGWEDGLALSTRQLKWIAEHFDVLSLNVHFIGPDNKKNIEISPNDIVALKDQNQHLKFYCMLFATTLREPIFDPKSMSDWVIRNKDGKEALGIRRGYDGDPNHMMDLGNKEYAEFFRNFIIEHATQYHADGVAIDEVMWKGYWGVDIKDMMNYTSVEEIRKTCYEWLERIKTNNPKEVIHQAFWPEAQQHTDGIWGEASFRSSFRYPFEYEIFYEDMNYSEIIRSLTDLGAEDETYIWAAYYEHDKPEELEYAIATYLLGKKGNHVVFQPHPVKDGGYPNNLSGYSIQTCIEEYENNKQYFDIELGEPVGDFYTQKINGRKIWIRYYTNGAVFSNPNQ